MMTRVCLKICSKTGVANSNKKIVMWLPALLNSCLLNEKGKKWVVLFFTVSVSLLSRSVFLISFCLHSLSNSLCSKILPSIICTFTAVILSPCLGLEFTDAEKGESYSQ